MTDNLCCPDCIGDEGMGKLFPLFVPYEDVCSYCNKTSAVASVTYLRDYFDPLLSIYEESEDGEYVTDLLQRDWCLFPDKDRAQASLLLGDIIEDGNLPRKKFHCSESEKSDQLNVWKELSSELKEANRYFPITSLNLGRLKELWDHILVRSEVIGLNWYRARANSDDQCFNIDQMGAPPGRKASHGRANPVGIPYLYLASNSETAVCEIRPHTGETVNIANFRIPEKMTFVDLREPRKLVSPFMLEGEKDIKLMRQDIGFLELLGEELTKPVLPESAAIDYIPSQYLCEFIKKCNFDGVIYKSSVGNGINLAIFDPYKAEGHEEVEKRVVKSVTVETEVVN
ncbi:RES family NAD+ phosphorylase [Curvivirga sp.]|uniref:RES family NAD+ phosphorylase n=1 Tax=Curvivirga sp. TaxID=2856848 RepID=UPI003B5C93CB